MKIGEAQKTYSAQIKTLYQKRSELLKMREECEKNGDAETLKSVIEEFTRVDDEYSKASDFMEGFGTYRNMLLNAENSKRQSDAMAAQADETAKCLEIARRISKGDIVPRKDEEKLMNFNKDLYMMAKNMAFMHMNEERKKHDSLWDDEDKPEEYEMSAEETVDSMDCAMTMPDISVPESPEFML